MNLQLFFRRLVSDRLNTLVILVSLILGMACVHLISVFILRELCTDSFQVDKARIFALNTNDPWNPGNKMFFCRLGSAEYMKENFSQVEDICRVGANQQKTYKRNRHTQGEWCKN